MATMKIRSRHLTRSERIRGTAFPRADKNHLYGVRCCLSNAERLGCLWAEATLGFLSEAAGGSAVSKNIGR